MVSNVGSLRVYPAEEKKIFDCRLIKYLELIELKVPARYKIKFGNIGFSLKDML